MSERLTNALLKSAVVTTSAWSTQNKEKKQLKRSERIFVFVMDKARKKK